MTTTHGAISDKTQTKETRFYNLVMFSEGAVPLVTLNLFVLCGTIFVCGYNLPFNLSIFSLLLYREVVLFFNYFISLYTGILQLC